MYSGREQSRCHASAPPAPEEPHSTESNRPGTGLLYQFMDCLNYMMNPDNIMENFNQDHSTDGNQKHGGAHPCPAMNRGYQAPHCPNFKPDKAQEAKEKATETPSEVKTASAAEEEKRSGFENFYENLKPAVANAVPLGTDANIMTTSVGVAAKEVEAENKETQKKDSTETEVSKPVEEVLREKLQQKLDEMERELDSKKNRSSSPTISYTSEDSDEINGRKCHQLIVYNVSFLILIIFIGDREWTVLDNEEPEGAAGVSTPVRDLGAVPKENKQVEDKATLTENSSSGSSMFGSAHGGAAKEEEKEKPKKDAEEPKSDDPKKGKPLTFEEMGKQLKAHIEEFQKLAVPIGPPASSARATPFAPGIYPHPQPPQRRVYHPSKSLVYLMAIRELIQFY